MFADIAALFQISCTAKLFWNRVLVKQKYAFIRKFLWCKITGIEWEQFNMDMERKKM